MNRTLNAAKLDFYAGKSMIGMTAILTVIAVIIGVASHGPDYAMIMMMIFGVTSSGSVFSVHEKNHSEKLYGTLPLKKNELIMGRYLYALIIGSVYITAAGILGFVMTKIMGLNFNFLEYWATIGIGFAYFCFAVGVAYPIYFKFSFSKAYIFTMLPMYIIAVAFLILTRKTNIAADIAQISKFFADHVYLAPIFGIAGGLLLLIVSAAIANLIYTQKEI